MKRTLCAVGLAALCVTRVTPGAAQPVADHLKCYKVRDPQPKVLYTADLGGLVAEPGCRIKVPAAMACVPSTKTIIGPPTPPGGGGTGTPNSFFCYKVKCPTVTLPTLTGADQFGSHAVTPRTAKFLCAPLAGPSTTTTTTASTTTTSTASTTTTTTTSTSSTTTTTLRLVDNGDGTVTDRQTGLIWEKKDNTCPGPHCFSDLYSWSASSSTPDGTAFTSFLDTLNGGATGVGNCVSANGSTITGGFNGHCDWRLPTITELRTIIDLSAPGCGPGACINPIFGPSFLCFNLWSSTTASSDPTMAWGVTPCGGSYFFGNKTDSDTIRAVRAGS